MRAEDVAAQVPPGGRSAVWLYNEVKSRRVLVSLALHHAFAGFPALGQCDRPRTVAALRSHATLGLLHIARFHLAERTLVTQVGLGIGDIANSEKRAKPGRATRSQPPAWPDGPCGRVAAAAWNGQVVAYAAHLTQVLRGAALTVAPVPPGWAERCAARLSDLAFHAFTGDLDGPAERQAAALAAHWFERDLVPLAGEWLHDLAAAEHMVTLSDGAEPRKRAAAVGMMARTLLTSTPLAERAARAGDLLVDLLSASPKEPAEVRDLLDAASRRGLALLRYGDVAEAEASFRLSAQVDDAPLPEHDKVAYVARARHNLGEALLDAGRPLAAMVEIEHARRDRDGARTEGGRTEGGDDGAVWRRRTLTEQARARACYAAGRVVEGVRLAEEVLNDRRDRLGGLDNANTAAARVTLAEALLAAGHPTEARYHLTEAHRHRVESLPRHGYKTQFDVVKLAEIELELEDPDAALRLLADSCATSEWFEQHVSHRLAADARRVHALALASTGDLTAAELILRDLLASPRRGGEADPVTLTLRRALARVLMSGGEFDGAADLLHDVRRAETHIGDDPAGQAETLLLLARAAHALDEDPCPHADEVAALTASGIDPTHLHILTARHDQAVRLVQAGDLDSAAALVHTLTRRDHLAHDRPALGDGHPLLAKALALTTRLGARADSAKDDQLWEEA
ncbi:hypothetical protein Ssi02_06670 [Sinosporangium siamense]|uniref:Tetratricopeptide repeat protein n=1 Tax=Sinosporangium siamense TaxID=1367973 RepID=A0A919V546_9ACTN|nr:hypothetical protein Ssi02_06670 [Sinosporangium siamense]